MDYRAPGAGIAFVPCTCGELVQGTLEGEPFLVSCPIDLYSRVRVVVGGEHSVVTTSVVRSRSVEREERTAKAVTTAHDPTFKARRAAANTLAALGYPDLPFTLEVSCPLPPSKGFGTSTADVVGAITAAAAAVGSSLKPEQMARLAVAIEPSDGTMFPGLALFDHRAGRRWETLGPAPSLLVAVLEFEGVVDTMAYNARLDLASLRSLEPGHREALGLLRQGVQEDRPDLIGLAATISARINQQLLPKPELEGVISLGTEAGALGVCAAHSGTALGVLFRPEEIQGARTLLAEARCHLQGLRDGWISRLVGGGAQAVFDRGDTENRQMDEVETGSPMSPW